MPVKSNTFLDNCATVSRLVQIESALGRRQLASAKARTPDKEVTKVTATCSVLAIFSPCGHAVCSARPKRGHDRSPGFDARPSELRPCVETLSDSNDHI